MFHDDYEKAIDLMIEIHKKYKEQINPKIKIKLETTAEKNKIYVNKFY